MGGVLCFVCKRERGRVCVCGRMESRQIEIWSLIKTDISLPIPKRWFCSVMVITLDSDSNDPGSIPGRTFFFFFFVYIVIYIEHK